MNENYAAVVVTIGSVYPLAKCDNVVGTSVFGYQAIVSKDTKPGELMLFFPAECQLSHEYCRANNLYRDKDQNTDTTKAGYLDLNRRVRAIKFRGHTSNCLLMPLNSLPGRSRPAPGAVFDTWEGAEICRKYFSRVKETSSRPGRPQKEPRVERKFFPEHVDTSQYHRSAHLIDQYEEVVVTQKLHGTSVRIAHTKIPRKLSWLEKFARRLGVAVNEFEYKFVYGSRRVTKNDDSPGFYESDVWGRHAAELDGKIPKGYIVFGEIVGWVSETSPIQKGYTYDLPPGQSRMYVYRVAHINEDGVLHDLTHTQLEHWCQARGLNAVPRLLSTTHIHFRPDVWLDVAYYPRWDTAVRLADPKSVDEGVCVRAENPLRILKLKSPLFLEYETKQLDQDVADIEEQAAQ